MSRVLTLYRDFPPWQAEFVFIVQDLDAGLRLMNEQAATKSGNEGAYCVPRDVPCCTGTVAWFTDPDANRSAGLRPAAASPPVQTRTVSSGTLGGTDSRAAGLWRPACDSG